MAGRAGSANEDKEARRAAQSTANRRWNVLRAILNSAFDNDPARVPTDSAWRRVPAFEKVDRSRTRTLTTAEAKRLLAALDEDMRNLSKGDLFTGRRHGELQALIASDIGSDYVHVRESKGKIPHHAAQQSGVRIPELMKGKGAKDYVIARLTRLEVSRRMHTACGWKLLRKNKSRPKNDWVYEGSGRSWTRPPYSTICAAPNGSLLLNAGAASDPIQELLGHADLRMTRRAYAHMAGVFSIEVL